jgi:peroxiredoxin
LQQAIGVDMPTFAANAADKMYVALSNSGGLPAVVYHYSPNATQVGEWTKWDIELQEFADKGIDLNNVDKFYIGIGDKSNFQAGGSGMMLFDDVYLYPIPEPEPTP